MREAILHRYELLSDKSTSNGAREYTKVQVANVKFHQFGVSYDDMNKGIGAFSSAIIEYDDGFLDNVPVELIQFVDNQATLN